jgi:1-deoxy-D-xylulose-5-phosphate reductoisomerase
MRLPIALGLSWPDRVADVAPPCDWTRATSWTFEPLDEEVFGAVRLAREAVAASATHPAVYNAANEECVAAFLAGRIGFLDIVSTVARVLEEHVGTPSDALDLDAVLAAEGWARARAHEVLARR